MKKICLLTLLLTIVFMSSAQTQINIAIGDRSVTATLVDNSATRELTAILSRGPVTVEMDDYGGFEKVGALPQSLTTSNSQITAQLGDIMLYQGRNMVIFYGSNLWSYTRLGKIDGATAEGLRQFLGNGSISVRLSLDSESGIEEVSTENPEPGEVYDLLGNPVSTRPLRSGIYIIDGRKTLIR